MHVNIIWGTNEVYSGYLALRFILWLDFACVELIEQVGSRRGGMLHTDSSGFGMHTDMTSGANEVHFGCSALSLPSSLDFVHMELVVLIGTHRGGKFQPTKMYLKCTSS